MFASLSSNENIYMWVFVGAQGHCGTSAKNCVPVGPEYFKNIKQTNNF